MTTLIAEEDHLDGVSLDILCAATSGELSLTQQEIERGLDALHSALFGRRLPLVVLVEDDYDEADLFREALKGVGVAVEFMHFRDGQRAIDFFGGKGCFSDRQRFPLPQLTVLDLNLTRCSGLEILREIRCKLVEPLVVVALTASNDRCEMKRPIASKLMGGSTSRKGRPT